MADWWFEKIFVVICSKCGEMEEQHFDSIEKGKKYFRKEGWRIGKENVVCPFCRGLREG